MKKFKTLMGLAVVFSAMLFSACEFISSPFKPKVGSIEGRVIYSNSQDSSGIIVTLDKTDGLRTASVLNFTEPGVPVNAARTIAGNSVVGKDGFFSFSNLEPGLYTVYASTNDSLERAVYTNVQVRAAETTTIDSLKLTATGSISGKITVDGTSTGNEGFIVYVGSTSYSAITDESGNYTISNVPAEKTYNLYIMKGGLTWPVENPVKVEAGKTASVATRNFTSAEIKNGITGDKGENGISIKWRGYFASADEVLNPVSLDAYYNTTDGCSYIYDGSEWQLLAQAGKDFVNTAKKEIFLQNTLIYNSFGPNYQNFITLFDETPEIKIGDKIRIDYKVVADDDTDLLVKLVDYTGEWLILSEENHIIANTNKFTKGTIEAEIIAEPEGTGPKACLLCISEENITNPVELTFTQLDVYINDEYVETNPESLEKLDQSDSINIDNKYNIEYSATDRGIRFVTKILSNTTNSASVSFSFAEHKSGIEMTRNWTKNANNWTVCETFYPFVEAGKTYSFTITASQSDYILYKKTVTVTATGGLGEFKIENSDDYDVELTADRVIHITKEPKFTENPNINITRQGIYYELYEADNNNWNWIYSQESWYDTTDGTLSLKTDSDGITNWKSWDSIDACMSGHLYRVRARTYIKVAGYQDNGQTYFKMNDEKTERKPWGGNIKKVAILPLFPFGYDGIEDLTNYPGEMSTIEQRMGDQSQSLRSPAIIVDYNSVFYEPAGIPYYKSATKSTFNGWYFGNGSFYSATFPMTIADSYVQKVPEEEKGLPTSMYVNGERIDYICGLTPDISATFKFTIMDGDTELKSFENKAGTQLILPSNLVKKDFDFAGFYVDKELTQALTPKNVMPYKNTCIYTKWAPVQYNISYNLNGGTLPEEYATGFSGLYEITLPVPTHNEYYFGGWYTTSSFAEGSEIEFIPAGADSSIELWAKWLEKPETSEWLLLSNGSYFFIQSGNVWTSNNKSVDNSTAICSWTIELYKECRVSIPWTVSSESNYDKLNITLDGEIVVDDSSGEKSDTIKKTLSAGIHTLTASYSKDNSSGVNDDCATITLNLVY